MTDRRTIVFLGTPDFAVPSLEALVREGHDLALVVTQPDRPRGRGRTLTPPPVKQAAGKHGLAVLQPASLRSPEARDRIASLAPDFLAVVAYGELLPPPLLNLPPLGAVNIHPSLLPAYRGPAPIQWTLINGESETGVCSMFMSEEMDAGDIILTEKVPIQPEETAGELHDRLALIGAEVLVRTIRLVAAGQAAPVPQDDSRASYAPRLTKAHGRIDWRQPAHRPVDLIRGMTPWPGAYTFWDEKRLAIHRAEAVAGQATAPPGTVLPGFSGELRVQAGQDALSILRIQGASGKVLNIDDFLRGCFVPENALFS